MWREALDILKNGELTGVELKDSLIFFNFDGQGLLVRNLILLPLEGRGRPEFPNGRHLISRDSKMILLTISTV